MLTSVKKLGNIKDKVVMVRVDFNVPLKNGRIFDDFRIQKSLPTILFLKKKGARIVLVSHAGSDGSQSLAPMAKRLNTFIPTMFTKFSGGDEVYELIESMKHGDVLLLENIRRNEGEMNNTAYFGQELASYCDIYVNDAFSVSHRKHASIVGVPKYVPSYAGLQLEDEIKHLNVVVKKPKHPFLFILGGAKFETKLPLIKKYLKVADCIFMSGALVNNFFKAKGYEIGVSVVDDKDFGVRQFLKNKKIMLPSDVLVLQGGKSYVKKSNEVSKQEKIVDIGPDSVQELIAVIKKSKLVLWNGPTGYYEGGYTKATETLLKNLAQSSATSIIGGGDTVSLASKLKLDTKLAFVSTGGGATLDFLASGTLPGIKALEK